MKEMLLDDYGLIIIRALTNSHPEVYEDYFYRQLSELTSKNYSVRELEFKFEKIFQLIETQVNEKYLNDLNFYNKHKALDKSLPSEQRYNYPKPNLANIPIMRIKFPSGGSQDLSGLNKYFYIQDLFLVREAVKKTLFGLVDTIKDKEPTKQTHLLRLYFEKGCKPLTKPQVIKLAGEIKSSPQTLVNKWISLKANRYDHTDNSNNIKSFIKSYEYLLSYFSETNKTAQNSVKLKLEQLKETYPEYAH